MKVFILATCRNAELIHYTLLVFKTLRVGFPTAQIKVHVNGSGCGGNWHELVADAAEGANCELVYLKDSITHHEWIDQLIERESGDFWIVDTDMIFYGSVEGWKFETPLAGYLVPEFDDPFLKATTRSRLHTSLMQIRPIEFRAQLLKYQTSQPITIYNPHHSPIYPVVIPLNGNAVFYDTMSAAYHAIGGTPFTDQQKNAYFHFHYGTFSDLVGDSVGPNAAEARRYVLEHPESGVGLWRLQDEWFNSRQHVTDGVDVIDPIKPEDAKDAVQWNIDLCCGNKSAMQFCDQWYRYCHGIDDLVDTMRDGRPRMSKDQMVSLFFKAALLYNSDFFMANRDALLPIVLQVTNTYRDSLAWEKSPMSHLRQMADVFRTCGNEMFIMVALLCGGEQHMRNMSLKIKERDWLGQHDSSGNPV